MARTPAGTSRNGPRKSGGGSAGEPISGEARYVRRVLIALSLAALFILAWQVRSVLLMLFGAVVVAAVFRALGGHIQKTGCREGPAVGLAILLILGGAAAMIILFGSHVASQMDTLGKALPEAWKSFEQRVGDMGLGDQLKKLTDAQGNSSLSNVGRTIMSIGSGLADVMVVLLAGAFLALQPRFYKSGAIKLVPESKRALLSEAMDESECALRLWLEGQLIAMVAVGVATGVGLWALGMPSALLLGLLAGLLEFIPFVGPIVSAVPALLLALAVSPDIALYVLLLYFAVQQLEGLILTPLVQQYAVDLPGVVLLFSLIVFGTLFGVLGVVLAAPATVVAYVLVKRLYVIETLDTATSIPGSEEDKDESAVNRT